MKRRIPVRKHKRVIKTRKGKRVTTVHKHRRKVTKKRMIRPRKISNLSKLKRDFVIPADKITADKITRRGKTSAISHRMGGAGGTNRDDEYFIDIIRDKKLPAGVRKQALNEYKSIRARDVIKDRIDIGNEKFIEDLEKDFGEFDETMLKVRERPKSAISFASKTAKPQMTVRTKKGVQKRGAYKVPLIKNAKGELKRIAMGKFVPGRTREIEKKAEINKKQAERRADAQQQKSLVNTIKKDHAFGIKSDKDFQKDIDALADKMSGGK
ncbi:hypothetical protein GOV10_06420 [Candidatus Woesearchaeota archaeon]|nr:hypothetical protein [Candidatus Woesearchaeota archaeon]